MVGDPLLNQGLGNVLKQFHWPQNAVPEHYHTTACGYLITARLVPRRRTLAHAPTTSVSHDRSGRQMDLPPRHGRPPAGSVSMLGFYLADHRRRRRLHSFGVGSRTQFPPLSDEARSEPESTKMIIHRVRAALISAAAVADADAVDRQTDRQRAMACIGMNVEAVN